MTLLSVGSIQSQPARVPLRKQAVCLTRLLSSFLHQYICSLLTCSCAWLLTFANGQAAGRSYWSSKKYMGNRACFFFFPVNWNLPSFNLSDRTLHQSSQNVHAPEEPG